MGRKTRKNISNDDIEKKEKKERKEEEENEENEENIEENENFQEFEENKHIDLVLYIYTQLLMYRNNIAIPLCENLTPDLLSNFMLNNC